MNFQSQGKKRIFTTTVLNGWKRPALDMDLKMEELMVGDGSRLNGLTLVDSGIRQEMNVIIVAIRKSNREMVFNPSSQTRIESGDTLIALGHTTDLDRLATKLGGS
jgi:voltage-gated potassium channel